MTTKQVIELLLKRMNTGNEIMPDTFGAADYRTGNVYLQQRDLNVATTLWQEKHDSSGLSQVASTMHLYGSLTDDDYEQIIKTLNGDNYDGTTSN